MTPPPIKRHQSQTERDLAGIAARKERDAAPVEFASEEDSMAHDVDERKVLRSKRDTKERLEKLEDKHDRVDSKVDGIDSRLSRMEGKLDTALSVLVPDRKEAHVTERARIDSRTKIILGIVGLVGTALGILIGSGCA